MSTTHWADQWSRRLALTFGIALAILEVAYNWGDPSWWPFILVDSIAAGLLVYGALRNDRVLARGGASPAPCSTWRSS